jgi:class 3 adenylate cyclase
MADRHPERVAALVLYAAIMRNTAAADYEWARSPEERRAAFEEMIAGWGDADNAGDFAPSMAGDERFRQWMARLQRLSASPGTVAAMVEASQEIDVRSVLPTLEVPTLVMHRSGDRVIDVRHSQFAAQQIPGARYVELEGIDNLPSAGDSESIVHEIEEFLTGGRTGSEAERALLTVMFTDIVDSTTRAAELGDRRWRDVLAGHDAIVRKELDRFDGQEVKTIGDGFLAVFGGAPTRAVQCARAIASATNETGCAIRAGLHTGECELIGDDVGGMAVHLAARVSAMAQPGEILVSGTLHDAVLGSPVTFEPRGAHTLKGVPGEWPVYAVTGTG